MYGCIHNSLSFPQSPINTGITVLIRFKLSLGLLHLTIRVKEEAWVAGKKHA
jgi:hypothetical protein